MHHRGFSTRSRFRHGRHSHWRHGRGGPRARRGDVRAAVLALLAERPMHGYEMIKELDERTGGAWRPSAGSIYPTLQLLEDEGLIKGEESEGKRRFTLTDAGESEQSSKSGSAPWEEVTAGAAPETLALGRSVHQLREAVAQVFHAADEDQRQRVRELLDETRRKIYGILAEDG
jgi:DNA-binding PadR family transcriptional regulator